MYITHIKQFLNNNIYIFLFILYSICVKIIQTTTIEYNTNYLIKFSWIEQIGLINLILFIIYYNNYILSNNKILFSISFIISAFFWELIQYFKSNNFLNYFTMTKDIFANYKSILLLLFILIIIISSIILTYINFYNKTIIIYRLLIIIFILFILFIEYLIEANNNNNIKLHIHHLQLGILLLLLCYNINFYIPIIGTSFGIVLLIHGFLFWGYLPIISPKTKKYYVGNKLGAISTKNYRSMILIYK